MKKRLRDGAGNIHRHGFTERIDQADLILDWPAMTLRDRPASREENRDEYRQTLHISPLSSIDKWSPPAATLFAWSDGRLSFDFFK